MRFLFQARQRALLLALLLYPLSVAILLWLLPAPIHLRFSVKSGGHQFTPTLQPALARLASAVQHPATIQDSFIEQVDLNTEIMKSIPLDPGGQSLARLRDYIHSRDGSLYLTMNDSGFNMVSAWNGRTGKFLFEKFCVARSLKQMACSVDGSLIALVSQDDSGDLDIYHARTGNILGHLPGLHGRSFQYVVDLQFSLDSKWLLCRYLTRWESEKSQTYIFDLTNFSAHHHFSTAESEEYEIIPGPEGFWISHWESFNKKLTLTNLDAHTGQQTILDSAISSGLTGSPRIFSDNAGHLYLIQTRTPLPDDWLQRARKTILGCLKILEIDWKTANEIVIRHISPDGKRILDEQAFAANLAVISPDGQYLILMTQTNEECKYTVYHYPIHLNWKNSLLWSLIPSALLLVLYCWRGIRSRPLD